MTTRIDLKLATADRHEALDQAFAGFAITTLPGYTAFLRAQAAALFPLEARLETSGVSRLVPDWSKRTRRAALAKDLSTLGLNTPPAIEIPAIDPEGLAGAVYVLEIVRQSARAQARHVLAADDPQLHAATTYLTYNEELPLWTSFAEQLDQIDADHFPAQLTAARQVFDVFLAAAQHFHPQRTAAAV
ncbi:biliverdin-producing heme oxygenase [Silvimonas soli]|uniref:biliverdin-producing heme oxygenase n=1 Tax=Silvimonas soli TaxID=2980100 RepID=UPI0024B3A484|nr:biliverdin-producing heme oxygenase [Silvimonas soli]